MRAMAVTDYARPLELVELPEPEVPPGSVLIRVLTCGVCYSDVKTARGHMAYSTTLELPHVPGHEICGQVVEAGPDSGFRPGECAVVYNYWSCGRCALCRMGQENLCLDLQGWVGFTHPGGFEELLAVPAERLLKLPERVSAEGAATLSCASGTSYRAVATRGRVRPGETAVILGVGGVGLHAVQVARAAGARVLAVDVSRAKLERARTLGAEGAGLPGEEAQALVAEHTGGLGADLVVDTAGQEETLHQGARLARRGGRVVGVGYGVGRFARVQTDDFVLREISFLGSRYCQRHELEGVLRLVAAGELEPVIDEVLPLEGANAAMERLERGEAVGRTVLRVSEAG